MLGAVAAAQLFSPLHRLMAWFAWLLALGWVWQAIAALRGMPQLPDLTGKEGAGLPQLASQGVPHLTVVVPACNEERAILATLRSLLDSTGIRLQIIAVDDRSKDRTGDLMDEVAGSAGPSPHLFTVLHNRQLPPGWLGKPHALDLGVRQATAPWLLFTDGDVAFAPRALELALRYAIASNLDHLVLAPTLLRRGFAEDAMQASIQAMAQWAVRLWKVADPVARDFLGVGGFNLVRREAFDRVGGFSALQMEVLEDVSLGWLIKRAGFRSAVALGPGLVNLRWIEGYFGIVRNLEKNGFAAFRYRTWLACAGCLGLVAQALLPLAAMGADWPAAAAGVLIYLDIGLVFWANRRLNGISPAAAVLFAPSVLVLAFGFLRSLALTLAHGGVEWRGTRYPLVELRRRAIRWR